MEDANKEVLDFVYQNIQMDKKNTSLSGSSDASASWYFLQSCKNSLNSVHVVGNTDLLKAGITMLVFD